VVAIDHDRRYLAQAEWARKELGLERQVQLRHQDAYSLLGAAERFDLVLFLGVFYHLRYPLLVLDTLALVTQGLLVFQSMMLPRTESIPVPADLPLSDLAPMLDPGWPNVAFIEHRVEGDPSNWWAPTPSAVQALLRSSGFRVRLRPAPEIFLCEPDRANPSSFWKWDDREYWSVAGGTPG
jgi:tRNA (mo5U34)-methyltransferase